MDLANFTGDVAPDNVSLSAAVLAGLPACVYRAVKQCRIKPNRGIRNDTAMPSDRSGNLHCAGFLVAEKPEQLDTEILQGEASLTKLLTVTPVGEPGVDHTQVQGICKQPHIPSLGLHGGPVEVD